MAATTEPMIEMTGVHKRFGDVSALAGLDVHVGRGELVAILGPNGAGKTTAINILSTLLRPDAGTCRVGGFDVLDDPGAVRAMIGLTGQFAAVDESLTARENLVLFGRLLKLGRRRARETAGDLLERFDLAEVAERRVGTFSGGMRRRLDLAVSLLAEPPVLFLDEPTTGLDPRSRQSLWQVVRRLQTRGVTIVLTTQYLEEADQLADRIVVVDRGSVIAEGSADRLKSQVGGALLELTIPDPADRQLAGRVLTAEPVADGVTVPADDSGTILDAVTRLAGIDVVIDDIAIRRPTLDDVFLALTGHAAGDDPGAATGEEVTSR